MDQLKSFSTDVCDLICNSNWQIYHVAILKDTTYFFESAGFTFEISCDPTEIIYQTGYGYAELVNGKHIVSLVTETGIIYFDGLKTGCKEFETLIK